jgi:AraC-like DNA-binding protein
VSQRTSGDALQIQVCPNGTPGLVFHVSGQAPAISSIATRSLTFSGLPLFFLHGQGSEPSLMNFKSGPLTVLQVAFKPQALSSIFGLDAAALPRGFLDAGEIGAEHLLLQLLSTESVEARIQAIWAFLEHKLAMAKPRDELIETSLELIQNGIGTVTVRSLVAALPLSERQFEKRFRRVVGCPPQRFIRVRRINEALRLMKSGRHQTLSEVAHALHFYDQSHFIREIKAFSWLTPKGIHQRIGELRQDHTGASWE